MKRRQTKLTDLTEICRMYTNLGQSYIDDHPLDEVLKWDVTTSMKYWRLGVIAQYALNHITSLRKVNKQMRQLIES